MLLADIGQLYHLQAMLRFRTDFLWTLVREHAEWKSDIFKRIERVEKRASLKKDTKVTAYTAQLLVWDGIDIHIIDKNTSLVGSEKSDDVLHEYTLSRATATDYGERLSFMNIEIDILQHTHGPE